MCGIAGIISPNLRQLAERCRPGIEESLRHRGPDDFAVWEGEHVRLCHWRLAVIDLSAAGRQPMTSRDGRYVIAYNGEVYNAPELRRTIEDRPNFVWRGHSDTEVILEAFAAWGPEVFSKL